MMPPTRKNRADAPRNHGALGRPRQSRNAPKARATPPKVKPKLRRSFVVAGGGLGMASVKLELLHPLLVVLDHGLVLLHEDPLVDDEHVYVGPHEAAVRILRRADDGLAAHVEGGVDHHRAAGEL